jgi:hypothetical protein
MDVPPSGQDAVMNRIRASNARWSRLGDVLVVRSPSGRPGQTAARGDAADSARRLLVPEQHLHVVTQTARLFQ